MRSTNPELCFRSLTAITRCICIATACLLPLLPDQNQASNLQDDAAANRIQPTDKADRNRVVGSVVFGGPEGHILQSPQEGGRVTIWNAKNGIRSGELEAPALSEGKYAWPLRISPKGDLALGAIISPPGIISTCRQFALWNTEAGKNLEDHNVFTHFFVDMAFDQTGRPLVVFREDDQIVLWNARTQRRLASYRTPKFPFSFGVARLTHDGQRLIIPRNRRELAIIDTRTLKTIRILKDDLEGISDIVVSDDRKTVAVTRIIEMKKGDPDGAATVWNLETGEVMRQLRSPTRFTAFKLSDDGQLAAAISFGGIKTPDLPIDTNAIFGPIRDGGVDYVAVYSEATVWRLTENGKKRRLVSTWPWSCRSIDFSCEETMCTINRIRSQASGNQIEEYLRYNIADGAEVKDLEFINRVCPKLQLAANDGRDTVERVAVNSARDRVVVWIKEPARAVLFDLKTGKKLTELTHDTK